jgi:hypothetical protein
MPSDATSLRVSASLWGRRISLNRVTPVLFTHSTDSRIFSASLGALCGKNLCTPRQRRFASHSTAHSLCGSLRFFLCVSLSLPKASAVNGFDFHFANA